MQDPIESPRLTRRRFLKVVSALAVGGTTAGAAVALGLERKATAPATPSLPPPLGERRQFHSRPDLVPPRVIVTSSGAVGEGLLFLTPDNGAGTEGPMIVDDAGELVWLRPDSGMQAANLQVTRYKGQPVLAWWEGTTDGGIGSGEFVLADASYRELTRVRAATGRRADLHEFVLTPQGTALLFADLAVPPPATQGDSPPPWHVLDCAVQEIDVASGALLWEWHTVDHIGIEESVVRPPSTPGTVYDYVHANSIELDTDGALLVSARNTSAIYKIDPVSGEIVWRLGGTHSDFAMGPGAGFRFQHDARRGADGTLTLFDDETPPAAARALVLRLDETAMSASLVRAYTRPSATTVTSQGNTQILPNGNVFVGWGASPYCTEFGPAGDVRFDATYPAAKQSYRAFRQPWVGRPTDSPEIALERATDGTLTVYASWNGATEVDRWEVLAGPDARALSTVATAPAPGFETAIALRTEAPLLSVRALDAAGTILGTSALAPT